MENLVLFDNYTRESLLPLTFYRPIAEIRIGLLTIREKWEKHLDVKASHLTQDYLSRKFPVLVERDNYFIAGNVLPTPELVAQIKQLQPESGLSYNEKLIAANIPGHLIPPSQEIPFNDLKLTTVDNLVTISKPADVFLLNEEQIIIDFDLVTKGRSSQLLPAHVNRFGSHPIFIDEGAQVLASSINTTDGPVYIGKNALVMEGSLLRGPIAICEHAVVKMGAKIYKGTTLGPWSKVGGELSNCVFFAYSNKGHDGYLGNSVVAEWCNFGADSNCSNLKNNYSEVKAWSYVDKKLMPTGLVFHGLIMADHSKTSINTMLNTGTIIGVNANIVAGDFPPKFIPSFTWNIGNKIAVYDLAKAVETARTIMARRDIELSKTDHSIMEHVFRLTVEYRKSINKDELH